MIEVRADDLQHDLHVLRDQLRALEPARAGQDHEPTLVLTDQTLEERRVETVGVLEGIDHRVGGPQVEERCDVGLTRIEIDEERAAGGPLGQAHRQIGGDGGDSKPAFAGEHRRDALGPTRRMRSARKPQELLESGREVSRLDGTEQELDRPGTDDLDDEVGGEIDPAPEHRPLRECADERLDHPRRRTIGAGRSIIGEIHHDEIRSTRTTLLDSLRNPAKLAHEQRSRAVAEQPADRRVQATHEDRTEHAGHLGLHAHLAGMLLWPNGWGMISPTPGMPGTRGKSFFSPGRRSNRRRASGPDPGGSALTSLTVTTNRSSVSAFWKRVLRKRAPRIGMSPSTGIFATACRTSLLSRPAMAKDSPSLRLMVVAASFFRITGMLNPLDCNPWLKSRLDTSGLTRRLIVSPSITTGRKTRPTPNSLNSMLMVLFCCATGYGNSPPDRNLASLPLCVIRL